jgi:hypothetical protein
MKSFEIIREEDNTGLSGTGKVAEGIEFSNGKCVVCWCSDVSTIVIHENIKSIEIIMLSHSKSKINYI